MVLSTKLKAIQDILRKDVDSMREGVRVAGEAQRNSQLGWMLLPRDLEASYRPPVPGICVGAPGPPRSSLPPINSRLFRSRKNLTASTDGKRRALMLCSELECSYGSIQPGALTRQVTRQQP